MALKDYDGCKFVSRLLWIEKWGGALFSRNTRNKFLAWLSVGTVVTAIIAVYFLLFRSHSAISQLTLFLVLDSGSSFFAFLVILFGPIQYALSGLEFKAVPAVLADQPDFPEHCEDIPSSVTPLVSVRRNDGKPSRRFIDISFLSNDLIITMDAVLYVVCLLVSCWKDYVRVDHDSDRATSFLLKAIFLLSGLIEDTVFCTGFLLLAVAYRILGLRVWRLRTRLLVTMEEHDEQHKQHQQNQHQHNQQQQRDLSDASIKFQHEQDIAQYLLFESIRTKYEATFEAARSLSQRTTLLVLFMISMVLLQMISIGYSIFEQPKDVPLFSPDYAHFQMLRILLLLSILFFQIVISAANLMFASRRLAERLVRLECRVRQEIYQHHMLQQSLSIEDAVGSDGSTSTSLAWVSPHSVCYITSASQRALKQAQADLLKTLSYRVRNHPVRIQWGWFNLTTEWSVGISILMATAALGFIGIHLPK